MVKWLKCDVLLSTSSSSHPTPTPGCDFSSPWLHAGLQQIQKQVFSFRLHSYYWLENATVLAQSGHALQLRRTRSSWYAVCIGQLHFLPLVCIYQLALLSFLQSNVAWQYTVRQQWIFFGNSTVIQSLIYSTSSTFTLSVERFYWLRLHWEQNRHGSSDSSTSGTCCKWYLEPVR